MLNKYGDSTEPCLTPKFTSKQTDQTSFHLTQASHAICYTCSVVWCVCVCMTNIRGGGGMSYTFGGHGGGCDGADASIMRVHC